MKRTLLAAAIAIAIPTISISVTPAFSSEGNQSGDSLPIEVPKKDPSTWDCKRLDRHLAKNEKTKETTEIDLDELIQDLKEDTPKVEKAKKELKAAEASLTSTTDKAEKKQIKKEIRKKKRYIRSGERLIKRETRLIKRNNQRLELAEYNIRSLKAHMKRKGC